MSKPYDFERNNPIHLTRDAKGLNRLRPQGWLITMTASCRCELLMNRICIETSLN
jgi:hypothetical protein